MAKLKRYTNNKRTALTRIVRALLLLVCLIMSNEARSQNYFKNATPYHNSVRLTLSDSTYVIAEHTDRKHKEPLSHRTAYFWYTRDTIMQAQGTYHGKLLHGVYREFYSNHQPKVEGSFHMGKKTGLWRYWDKEGRLRKTSRWKNSKEQGRFTIYNEKGELVQKGRMHKGEVRNGNLLLKTIAKLKHRKIHSDEDDADKEPKEDNNEGLHNGG